MGAAECIRNVKSCRKVEQMKLKTTIILTGVAVVSVGVGGAVATIYAKRRAKRILEREVLKALEKVVRMRAEDYMPSGALGQSVFRRFLDGLSDRQLIAFCALMEVGHFAKVSGINTFHPTKEQIAAAAGKYMLEKHLAPRGRADLLSKLDTSDAFDALGAAYRMLK
jgi:hypothetical protein